MSKWTFYQLLIVIGFIGLLIVNNVFAVQIAKFFSFVASFIQPSILITFFVVILVIWGFSFILLFQKNKGKRLFTHKIWRIMPAITALLFVLSSVILIVLGLTTLSNISLEVRWILDIMVFYFLSIFYLFILSIMLRYGKPDTNKGVIVKSANIAVLILFALYFLFPILFRPY